MINSYAYKAKTLESEIKLLLKDMMIYPIIRDIFSGIQNPNCNYEDAINKALENTYVFKCPESYHGKTLCNLNIVINDPFFNLDFDSDEDEDDPVKKQKVSEEESKRKCPTGETKQKLSKEESKTLNNQNPTLEEKKELYFAYVFICFFHEFAHFYQRAHLKIIEEVINYCTPRVSDAIGESKKTKRRNQPKRYEEFGFDSEVMLFGKRLQYLSLGGAKFLLSGCLQQNLNQFQENFKKKNKENKSISLSLMRAENEDPYCLRLGICGIAAERFKHLI